MRPVTSNDSPSTSPSSLSSVFSFPTWVDERAARLVAAGVVVMTGGYLLTSSGVLLAVIAAGFVARVVAGPSLSPLALVVTRLIVPRLSSPARPVPGTPKRFAQAIGATLSLAALAAHVAGVSAVALVLVALITAAAFLESALGFCLGCTIFQRLMTVGLIPASVCAACNDLSLRPTTVAAH